MRGQEPFPVGYKIEIIHPERIAVRVVLEGDGALNRGPTDLAPEQMS